MSEDNVGTEHSFLSDQLLNSALRVLRGFARLFVGRMSVDVMIELLNRAVIEEGCRRVARDNQGKVVKSQVALLTGVKAERIKDSNTTMNYDDANLTIEARILKAWASSPEYRDKKTGETQELLIFGGGHTFQRLVANMAGRGVTVQTVLNRLSENGNVKIVNEHWVMLVDPDWRFLLPVENDMLNIGSFAVENLLKTIDWNYHHLTELEQRRLERGGWSVTLPEEKIPALREELNKMLRECHFNCLRTIRKYEDPGLVGYNSTLVGFNMYYWERELTGDGYTPLHRGVKRSFYY